MMNADTFIHEESNFCVPHLNKNELSLISYQNRTNHVYFLNGSSLKEMYVFVVKLFDSFVGHFTK